MTRRAEEIRTSTVLEIVVPLGELAQRASVKGNGRLIRFLFLASLFNGRFHAYSG